MNKEKESTLKVNTIPIQEVECIWRGKPSIFPYLLINRRLFGMTVVTVLLFSYLKFTWFLPTQLWILFYSICLIGGIRGWMQVTYFITKTDFVVKKGKYYYRLAKNEIRCEEYRIMANPLEVIFGCRTIQYGKYYGYHSSRGSNTNLWRETTRFWCIRDYEKVKILKYSQGSVDNL